MVKPCEQITQEVFIVEYSPLDFRARVVAQRCFTHLNPFEEKS